MRNRAKWLLLLTAVVGLFYWKILFTRQFSLLLDYEGANDAYAWDHFAAASMKQGAAPIWDPYSHSGRPFLGEMQTALFYPPKAILYAWPLNRSGILSPQLYHQFHAATHLLAAFLMFFLAVELGIGSFGAFVAAICFALGGFVGRIGWPHLLDSAIWLPLVCLFLLRALRRPFGPSVVLYSCLTGLALGLSVLAGGLHVAMMQAIQVVAAAAYSAFRDARRSGWRMPLLRNALVVVVVAAICFAAGAVQLLPSMEYSSRAQRYLAQWGEIPAGEKIPYVRLGESYLPKSLFSFLLGFPFGGDSGTGEMSPYYGVAPFILAIVGLLTNWEKPPVRFLAVLGVFAFVYTLGPFSLLHGLAYSLVPYLWISREAGRFIYLTQFGMAVLAGYGAGALFSGAAGLRGSLSGLTKALKWAAAAFSGIMVIPAVVPGVPVNDWVYLDLLFFIGTSGLVIWLVRGRPNAVAQFLLAALIVSNLHAFNWNIKNKMDVGRTGTDHFERLMGCAKLVQCLTISFTMRLGVILCPPCGILPPHWA